MKLYYSPAAGALASHIIIRELNLDVELIRVDVVDTFKTETGDDYYKINPKGYVPYLEIDQQTHLSEGLAILQFLADQKPQANMTPVEGTFERYQLQEWLTFVATEPQQIIGLFFVKDFFSKAGLNFMKEKLKKRLLILEFHLSNNEYLMGSNYSIADAYLFAIMNWISTFSLDIEISSYKNLNVYLDKIRSREAVQTAMKEEGLLA